MASSNGSSVLEMTDGQFQTWFAEMMNRGGGGYPYLSLALTYLEGRDWRASKVEGLSSHDRAEAIAVESRWRAARAHQIRELLASIPGALERYEREKVAAVRSARRRLSGRS